MTYDPFGPVRRQYVFRPRRCRQRIAQALGGGAGAVGAAALLRLGHRSVFSLAGGIDAWSQSVDPSVPRY